MESFKDIIQVFNNREISIICWIIAAMVILMILKKGRHTVTEFLISFKKFVFNPQIFTIIVLMLVYISFLIMIFHHFKLWDISLLKDTLYWVFGVAFILFLNTDSISKKDNYFKNALLGNVSLVILIEFLSNLYVFSLVFELISIPIIFFISVGSAMTEKDSANKSVKKFFDFIITTYGIIVIIFSIIHIAKDFEKVTTIGNLKAFLLGPILTTLYLPFIYFTALLMLYQTFFLRVKLAFQKDKKLIKYAKWVVLKKCRFNIKSIRIVSQKLDIYTSKERANILNELNILLTNKKPIPNK